jgi:hypothetical protein
MLDLNVGNIDRLARLALGLALIGLAFADRIGPWGYIGIVPVVTAVAAFCPVYRLLGIRTNWR